MDTVPIFPVAWLAVSQPFGLASVPMPGSNRRSQPSPRSGGCCLAVARADRCHLSTRRKAVERGLLILRAVAQSRLTIARPALWGCIPWGLSRVPPTALVPPHDAPPESGCRSFPAVSGLSRRPTPRGYRAMRGYRAAHFGLFGISNPQRCAWVRGGAGLVAVETAALHGHSQAMISPVYATPTHRPDLNRVLGEWVYLRCFGEQGSFAPHSSMGVFDGDTLIGASVFHNWVPSSGVMEISSAAVDRRWLHPRVIRCLFAFPFDEMGAQLVALRVSDRNENMISIARRFGFSEWHIPRLRGRDEGEYVFTLTEEAWRQHPVALRGEKR